ncbi:MAG: helix-turn-helix domain-containing protein [Erysipelotrichaceae bacterium]|nr:helix-turn-helix domain-containing protein [Erysipelotrichaceae bacterium]
MNKAGETIKGVLKKAGISQADLCDMTGIKPAAMSKYLSGEKYPRTEILMKIADALNVSLYTLLGKDEEKSVYEICRSALLARSGKKLTEEERKDLIKLILGD